MIVALIVACEIGFWVLIVAGLVARYLLKQPTLGIVLLALTPVVDVVLLIVTALDLIAGATATVFHGVAAIYLGFSLVYGKRMIRWADKRFAHKFANGSAPVVLSGRAYAVACAKDLVRTVVAAIIAAGVTGVLTLVAGDPDRTTQLYGVYQILFLIVAIEAVWTVSYFIWPKKSPAAKSETAGAVDW